MTNQPNTHDEERPSRGAPAPWTDPMNCPGGDGHDEHLALNGECPWCGADGDVDDIDRACTASYVTGGSDPSGTDCDQPAGHYPATQHEGPDPMGGTGRVRWTGGGSCAGDPLPYRDVEWVTP